MSSPTAHSETGFEKKRGLSHVEKREGYAQVHVTGLGTPLMDRRLEVLDAVATAGVSLDFLKLTTDGVSFLIPEERSETVQACLARYEFEMGHGRSIVMVHAVNMRDEEGLLAKIVATAIQNGATIDHLGDMHDRLLIVVESDQAADLVRTFQEQLAR